MILAQIEPEAAAAQRDMRRSFATRPIEKRSQLPPLFGPDLIGHEQYVASPWTCSKVEPDPVRTEQRPRAQRPCARIPFRYGTSSALRYDDDARRCCRPPHDAMHDDADEREQLERYGPADERECCSKQRVQRSPPHPQNVRRLKAENQRLRGFAR
jgi:hypothetical protein